MILCITSKCKMGCSHCLHDCKPEGVDIALETLKDAIDFIKRIGSVIILVSGGEPTEHPQFFDIMEILITEFGRKRLVISSTGDFFKDAKYSYRMKKLNVKVQVTNDPRYYPRPVENFDKSWVLYEDDIRTLTSQGRAINEKPIGKTTISCFNSRSIGCGINAQKFSQIVHIPESKNKFCCPLVSPDGNVFLVESLLCTSIGTIHDSDGALINNLRNLKCRNCGMVNVTAPELMALIEKDYSINLK